LQEVQMQVLALNGSPRMRASSTYHMLKPLLEGMEKAGGSVVIVEDATASHSTEAHAAALGLYRRTPLYPLLRVLSYQQLRDLSPGPEASPP